MNKKIPNIFTFISDFKKEEILNLDKNIGIIYRNYKEEHKKHKILEIKNFCKSNNRKFYLANNIKLAINLSLDGVYIPSFIKILGVQGYSLRKDFLIIGLQLPEVLCQILYFFLYFSLIPGNKCPAILSPQI